MSLATVLRFVEPRPGRRVLAPRPAGWPTVHQGINQGKNPCNRASSRQIKADGEIPERPRPLATWSLALGGTRPSISLCAFATLRLCVKTGPPPIHQGTNQGKNPCNRASSRHIKAYGKNPERLRPLATWSLALGGTRPSISLCAFATLRLWVKTGPPPIHQGTNQGKKPSNRASSRHIKAKAVFLGSCIRSPVSCANGRGRVPVLQTGGYILVGLYPGLRSGTRSSLGYNLAGLQPSVHGARPQIWPHLRSSASICGSSPGCGPCSRVWRISRLSSHWGYWRFSV